MLSVFVQSNDSRIAGEGAEKLVTFFAAQCDSQGKTAVDAFVAKCQTYLTEHVFRSGKKAKAGKSKVSYTISADDVDQMIEGLGVGAK